MTQALAIAARGAEATIEMAAYLGQQVVAKRRQVKGYRHPTLDARLRDERTRDEANLLAAARVAGVRVPIVYDADRQNATLLLEPIHGASLRSILASERPANGAKRLQALGQAIARLHDAGLVHGDLTTSNVLVPAEGGMDDLVLIDFGLGAFTDEAEERGVDLHLLEEALEATSAAAHELFAAFLEGYKSSPRATVTLRRLEDIRERGRYR